MDQINKQRNWHFICWKTWYATE